MNRIPFNNLRFSFHSSLAIFAVCFKALFGVHIPSGAYGIYQTLIRYSKVNKFLSALENLTIKQLVCNNRNIYIFHSLPDNDCYYNYYCPFACRFLYSIDTYVVIFSSTYTLIPDISLIAVVMFMPLNRYFFFYHIIVLQFRIIYNMYYVYNHLGLYPRDTSFGKVP